ncbi:MAG: polymer-forming cytoskeletal protein [Verrucomicrobiota bacterium]
MACPDCGHCQEESVLAVSTFCRKCGSNFQITAASRENARPNGKPDESPSSPFGVGKKPRGKEAAFIDGPSSILNATAPVATRRHSSGTSRNIWCVDCETSHRVSLGAASTNCPSCGAYISLGNVEIKSQRTGEIRTQGDVTVHRNGVVIGAIFAHNVTVHGKTLGKIFASEKLEFRRSGRVLGEVRCRELHITKGVKIEFVGGIETETAFIEGQLTGDLTCTKAFRLLRKGEATGTVRTKSVQTAKGASFDGIFEILPA